MGRAMIIICAGVLVSMGIIGISTADRGKLLAEESTKYAHEISAKNAAHTGIQIAMEKISQDTLWIEEYNSPDDRYLTTIENPIDSVYIYAEYINSNYATNEYWKSDSVRIVSEANIIIDSKISKATVTSVYLMAKFSNLVPPFAGALQFPSGYGSINVDGNAHEINGTDDDCGESKPPITVASDTTEEDLENHDLNTDASDPVSVDSTLNYEPTDELIRRLENSGNATTVTDDYSENLGTADNPGIFFIDGNVKLTGQQSEGYGIMVIKDSAHMDYEDEEGNTLEIRGNFTFNGLVIFENAQLFDGRGTPTINGSVLVGDTEGPTDIDVDIGGNIGINYSCKGEDYSKMAAANAVDQNKYTRLVTYEERLNF